MGHFLERFLSKTVLAFVAVFSLGVLLFLYPPDWHWQEFIRALRDALMVAGVIGTFIELWSASVLVDRAANELSEKLVGYGLPKAAQEAIHGLVHQTKRIYRDYLAEYRIVRTDPGFVRVYATVSYRVVNNGSSSEEYSPKLLEEGMYQPHVCSLEFGGRVFPTKESRNPKTGVVSWEPTSSVKLHPSGALDAIESLSADKVCSIRWDYTMDMPENYSAVISFGGMTINPMVRVIDVPEDFEFNASQEDGDACRHEDKSRTWEYGRAFIGGQHLRVWWRPREATISN